ncbi:alpha-galactosidase [Qipengyuania aquimaris]|uniref:alpha-galactosidase n=1 Tax=Qipengyuania aquimaris TaxID=255984 RepID=UPI001FD3CF98|nr:alpha-galactosidase [Qipengyuania aquimaris]UOR16567.1 alpha-galactosidase [Qipengyuania aquimaris]
MSETADLHALHGEEWSCIFERQADGTIAWRHLGARVEPRDLPPLEDLRGATTFSVEGEPAMQAAPIAGGGWFGPEALEVRDEAGNAIALTFDKQEIETSDKELVIRQEDTEAGLVLTVSFRPSSGDDLLVRTTVSNSGKAAVGIDHLASGLVPLPSSASTIISRRGRHSGEFAECREAMPAHGWERVVRQGMTGHGGPPSVEVLCGPADWHSGLVVSAQLAWSGDSRLAIAQTDEGFAVLQAEALLQGGEKRLEPGEIYSAPELLIAISTSGRNGASARQRSMVRDMVVWPGGAMKPRPVHLNSWEAVYFSHDEARIERLARAAAEFGAERFVLDDGWFANRNNDRAGLGDWIADREKYPNGLAPFASKVRDLGMEFGLWVEPEMVSPDSDLYRAHPDWALGPTRGTGPLARNQLVLDMRREDVRDYLFGRLDALLSEVPISYLKWDHNRPHTTSGGAAQIHGTYALLARLRKAHPGVEIESCAAGGGRIDAGIARHTHRFWTSDNIDALSRIEMQRGFLAFMPSEMMGAHIGASPSHATGRTQSLDFRAAIACQGHLGVELDPDALDESERKRLAHWIGFYKEWRHLIHAGAVHLGEAPNGLSWQAQGDGNSFLLWVVRQSPTPDRRDAPLLLPFAEGRDWKVRLLEKAGHPHVLAARDGAAILSMRTAPQDFSGSWLANAGLPLPALAAETAAIFHMEAA